MLISFKVYHTAMTLMHNDSDAKLVVVIIIASPVYLATIKPFGIYILLQICFHHLKVNQPIKYSELKGIIILQADNTRPSVQAVLF